MDPNTLPAWFQAGGVLAFAAAVWLEQRAMRIALDALRESLAAILEHVRKANDDGR
jgi:hypothetical protein